MDSVAIGSTVIAIREELMNYFKGSCVERFTLKTNVRLRNEEGRLQYQFERRQAQNERPCTLWIGDVPILTVKYLPDTVTFHDSVLQRSPQLRQVQKELDRFMDKYLVGVERKHIGLFKQPEVDDTELLSHTKLGKHNEEAIFEELALRYGFGINDSVYNTRIPEMPF